MSDGAIVTTTIKSKAIKPWKPFVRGRRVYRILDVFIIVTPKTVVGEQVSSLSLCISIYIYIYIITPPADRGLYFLFGTTLRNNIKPTTHNILPHPTVVANITTPKYTAWPGPARSVVVIVDFFVTARFRSFQSRGILDITRRCVTWRDWHVFGESLLLNFILYIRPRRGRHTSAPNEPLYKLLILLFRDSVSFITRQVLSGRSRLVDNKRVDVWRSTWVCVYSISTVVVMLLFTA